MTLPHRNRLSFYALAVGIGFVCIGIGLLMIGTPAVVHAQSEPAVKPTGDNSFCLLCHAQTDRSTILPDGSTLNISVDAEVIAKSVHGEQNESGALGCVDCHGEDAFPHNDPLPASQRALTIASTAVCVSCHTDQSTEMADSVHLTALASGNETAATCIDCHGAHDIQSAKDSPDVTARACGDCHQITFKDYARSVHGVALLEDGDPNVPTCTDCHGVHGIQNPTTAQFRNRSPEMCATCHADAELMQQYDISTNVFDSYLTDFHGATVALFEQEAPNVPTNKAVCIDCHGVHDIMPSDDIKSQVVRENLLATCQQCHPGATSDFPDAWVGHFPPTLESHPLLFMVNGFYTVLIPGTIGAFILLILTDVIRRVRRLFRRGEHSGA